MVFMDSKVVSSEGEYKVCAHPCKLFFTDGTTLKEQQLSNVPPNEYHFKKFQRHTKRKLLVGYVNCVSNSKHRSKLIINEKIKENETFKNSFNGAELDELSSHVEKLAQFPESSLFIGCSRY
ncbi:hypothetical protein JHK82_012159 [Glycine max]|uniref:Uncharacterized protein n=1 Tax=Glycine soja TaxID=3848 RepID=A0A0B2QYE4_GLYSO|nr:hypothetical protein JHK85_012487 [Glycine max]KAG5057161.1 hypothetical protein JHK86_012157 [Glycine max]KAG5154190.1 hypothetical protein JHK82_012159 [Glycine max]KHN25039.1 hypothetical protein glysoja_043715 [Glycine soja]